MKKNYDEHVIMFSGSCACVVMLILFLVTGCTTTETIAKGITTKNISGNGTWIDNHIGLNVESKIPEIKTTFISGDFSTQKAGTNAITYREESSSSVFNAKSITRKRFLSVTLTNNGDVSKVITAITKAIKKEEEEDQKQEKSELKK